MKCDVDIPAAHDSMALPLMLSLNKAKLEFSTQTQQQFYTQIVLLSAQSPPVMAAVRVTTP